MPLACMPPVLRRLPRPLCLRKHSSAFFDRTTARRLGFRLIGCAALRPLASCGPYCGTSCGIFRNRGNRGGDRGVVIPRPLQGSCVENHAPTISSVVITWGGKSFPPPHSLFLLLASLLSSLSSLSSARSVAHTAAAHRRTAGDQRRARKHRRAAGRQHRTPVRSHLLFSSLSTFLCILIPSLFFPVHRVLHRRVASRAAGDLAAAVAVRRWWISRRSISFPLFLFHPYSALAVLLFFSSPHRFFSSPPVNSLACRSWSYPSPTCRTILPSRWLTRSRKGQWRDPLVLPGKAPT